MLDLVLLRHDSRRAWNAQNLLTGWVDVDLDPRRRGRGLDPAGELLAAVDDLDLRILHTSVLTRAIRTAELALAAAGRSWLPVRRDWRLNERHYGDLQGKNKAAIKQEFGAAQLQLWRRSYDTPPPPLSPGSPFDVAGDPRYQDLDPIDIPRTECLKDVVARTVPYWESAIVPDLPCCGRPLAGWPWRSRAGGGARQSHPGLCASTWKSIAEDAITEPEVPTGIPFRMLLNDDLTVHWGPTWATPRLLPRRPRLWPARPTRRGPD